MESLIPVGLLENLDWNLVGLLELESSCGLLKSWNRFEFNLGGPFGILGGIFKFNSHGLSESQWNLRIQLDSCPIDFQLDCYGNLTGLS